MLNFRFSLTYLVVDVVLCYVHVEDDGEEVMMLLMLICECC